MGVKMIDEVPFKTGFYNLIGAVIPKCCVECETAKFHYEFRGEDVGIFLLCEERNKCPLINKTSEEVNDG